jgi:hypothetical protein
MMASADWFRMTLLVRSALTVALAAPLSPQDSAAAQSQGASLSPLAAASVHAVAATHNARTHSPTTAFDTLDFVYFREQVEPILMRDRGGFGPTVGACVTCHVKSATPMKLEPLQEREDGSVYWTEEQSRRNFEVVSGLVVPGAPERSRLLRQPLVASAGGSQFHVGGKMWESTDDPEWQTLANWVRTASETGGAVQATAAAPTLDFGFFRTCVQRIFLDKRPGRMECVNCHSSGARNFARSIPDGRAFWNEEESRQNFGVIARYVEPGQPLRSRFLMHPLHPEAGGDHFHGGGRRWESQDDPEWQMLAAWVRGERPTTCVTPEPPA